MKLPENKRIKKDNGTPIQKNKCSLSRRKPSIPGATIERNEERISF